MKQLFFGLLFFHLCLGTLDAQTKHRTDSVDSSIYFIYNEISSRDSVAFTLGIDNSKNKYTTQKKITHIPLVSEFSMYKDGDEDRFSFLFNDPQYSATEKKKIAAIILQGSDIESKLINEIRYITLDKKYNPVPSGNFMPIFPGGYRAMIQYLNEHFSVSSIDVNKEQLESHAYLVICFTIEKDGTLNHIKIIDSCNEDLDYKAYKLIKNMPKWVTSPQIGPRPIFIAMQLIFNKEL